MAQFNLHSGYSTGEEEPFFPTRRPQPPPSWSPGWPVQFWGATLRTFSDFVGSPTVDHVSLTLRVLRSEKWALVCRLLLGSLQVYLSRHSSSSQFLGPTGSYLPSSLGPAPGPLGRSICLGAEHQTDNLFVPLNSNFSFIGLCFAIFIYFAFFCPYLTSFYTLSSPLPAATLLSVHISLIYYFSLSH